MVDVRDKLSRAPIREALIDLRTRFDEKPCRSEFESVFEQIKSEYPKCDDIHSDRVEIKFGDSKSPLRSFEHSFCGLRCRSKDGRFVVQLKDSGITVSRLAPYHTWSELRSETLRLWKIYLDVTRPKSVTRVAVRYINRIMLSLNEGGIDLDDFFLLGIKVPDEVPQTFLSSLCQLKLVDEGSGAVANVNLTTQKIEEGALPVIFDIDVFLGGTHSSESDEIWKMLESLRELKNRIFFHSITQDTLELIS